MSRVLILDCGGQYTHLIKKILNESGYESKIFPADVTLSSLKDKINTDFKGIIISGGMGDVGQPLFKFDESWLKSGLPILGICYGHQLLARLFGGGAGKKNKEYGSQKLIVSKNNPFLNRGEYSVWTSHTQSVIQLPSHAESFANTRRDQNSIARFGPDIYGVQFHPEVSHSNTTQGVITKFASKVCNLLPYDKWDAAEWIRKNGNNFSKQFSSKRILLGLSGGVDSMTLAAFIRNNHPKDNLLAVYVDNGLNPDETKNEVVQFCSTNDIKLKVIDEKQRFLDSLIGIIDPVNKGMVIGREFIRCFEEQASKENMDYLAQGTIWSDVVESGVTKFSSVIKPHHNVGGIPKDITIKLVEPFRELFKDQVRQIAAFLNLDSRVISKKVFPGPGFAIRVDGEVTEEKIDTIKRATEIVDDILVDSDAYKKIWMASLS